MTILYVLIFLALLATVIVMFMGLTIMGGGAGSSGKLSEKFMWARIVLQGLTVALLLAALFLV